MTTVEWRLSVKDSEKSMANMGDFLISVSDWLEIHAGLAAWAQAVGASAGIAVAIALPWAQRRHDRSLQAHALATVLVAELADLLARVKMVAEVLDDAVLSVTAEAPRIEADPRGALVTELSIPEPPVLAASPHQLHLLGRGGVEVQMALMAVRRFSATIGDEARRWGSIDPGPLRDQLAAVERQLEKAWTRADHVRQGRIL